MGSWAQPFFLGTTSTATSTTPLWLLTTGGGQGVKGESIKHGKESWVNRGVTKHNPLQLFLHAPRHWRWEREKKQKRQGAVLPITEFFSNSGVLRTPNTPKRSFRRMAGGAFLAKGN